MKKNCLPIVCALITLSTPSCDKPAGPSSPEGKEDWTVCIPARKGGESTKALDYDEPNKKVLTSFRTTDLVYVYNKTRGALDAGILHPDADAASVNITGSLSGSYAVGDVLELRYGPYFPVAGGTFDYEEQDGSFGNLRDFAVATVNVTGVDAVNHTLTLEDAAFTNPYSIFRFSFVDADTGDPIPIDFLWIKSVRGNLVFQDNPDGTREYYGEIADGRFPREVYRAGSTDPVWLSLCYEAPDTSPETDWFAFAILDNVNKIVYDMSKMNDGKIVNGKFYAPTIGMMPLPKPAVTLSGGSTPVEPTQIGTSLYDLGYENYYTYENPGLDITVGSDGDQCRFKWTGSEAEGAVVRFQGTSYGMPQSFTTTASAFLEHLHKGALTLVLDGQTQIMGEASQAAIKVDKFYGEVVFQGSGTLTITASSTVGTQGITTADGTGAPSAGVPLNVHAASGYTLSVSGGDNGDGTGTWTYVVAPDSGAGLPGIPTFPGAGDPFND